MNKKTEETESKNHLIKFLKGQNSPEGKRLFEDWASEIMSEENINAMDEKTDQSIKDNLDKRIDNYVVQRNIKKISLKTKTIITMAASLAIIIGIGSIVLYTQNKPGITNELIHSVVVTVPYGEKKTVELSDGSVIHLNAGSELEYPSEFNKTERSLKLTGEAFFNVTKDPERPFIVTTDNITTTVMGTSFNIHAYKNEDIKVTVATGKVKVDYKPNEKAIHKTTIIEPGQQAMFNRTDSNLSKKIVETADYIGWQKNILTFNHEPLSVILSSLHREFNVHFECNDEELLHKTMKVSFENVDLATVIDELEFILDIKFYQTTSDTILIAKN
jgi:transmembrane sensor